MEELEDRTEEEVSILFVVSAVYLPLFISRSHSELTDDMSPWDLALFFVEPIKTSLAMTLLVLWAWRFVSSFFERERRATTLIRKGTIVGNDLHVIIVRRD